MIICENSETKGRIEANKDKKEELRLLSNAGLLKCPIPICNKEVIFKCGSKKIAHFAHKSQCVYTDHEPETIEHLKGKLILKEWLKKIFPDSKVELESWIYKTSQEADILVTHPDNSKLAFEFQCSRISEEKWQNRHKLYEKAGIQDFWIFNDDLYQIECDTNSKNYLKISGMLLGSIDNDYHLLAFLNVQAKLITLVWAEYITGDYLYRLYDLQEENVFIDRLELKNNLYFTQKFNEFRIYIDEKKEKIKKEEEEEETFKNFEKKYNVILLPTTKCVLCEKGNIVLRVGKHGPFGGCSNYPNCSNTYSVFELARDGLDQNCKNCPDSYRKVVFENINGKPTFLLKCEKCGGYAKIIENINTIEDLNKLAKILELDRKSKRYPYAYRPKYRTYNPFYFKYY